MAYTFALISLLSIFLLRKLFSKYYFTPTGFLSAVWIMFIGLKLLFGRDYYYSIYASMLFVLFIGAFFIGELLMFSYLSIQNKNLVSESDNKINLKINLEIFNRSLTIKRFNFLLFFLGVLSFIGSMIYLSLFASYFGSVINVLTAGWAVRGALEEISIPLFVRAILLLGYSAIVLSLVYQIIYNKFKWYFLLPYLSMLITAITQAGRAGFMMIIFQVFIASYWREIIKQLKRDKENNKFSISPESKLVKSTIRLILFIAVIFFGGDMLRSQDFSFNSEVIEQGLISFKAYLFGGIAGFTGYLKDYQLGGFSDLGWGRFSFSSLFDLLGIHKNTIGIYTNYLRKSDTDAIGINIFTAFRQFMDDFGILGTTFIMFFLGSSSHIFFRKAIKGNFSAIALMIVFYAFLVHTPFLAITVHTSILVSAILPFFLLNLFKRKITFTLNS